MYIYITDKQCLCTMVSSIHLNTDLKDLFRLWIHELKCSTKYDMWGHMLMTTQVSTNLPILEKSNIIYPQKCMPWNINGITTLYLCKKTVVMMYIYWTKVLSVYLLFLFIMWISITMYNQYPKLLFINNGEDCV